MILKDSDRVIELISDMQKDYPITESRLFADLGAYVSEGFALGIGGMIENQPTISQWIPVSERLPQDGELVLLTFIGSKKVDMETAIYDVKDGFATAEMYVGLNEILAWMPLPEPFKEVEDE